MKAGARFASNPYRLNIMCQGHIAIRKLNIYTIRMPQMILGILSVFLLYRIFEKIADEKLAFWITIIN